MTEKLFQCLFCLGTGYGTPPRTDRPKCPECNGEGQVPSTSAWAGYCRVLDYTGGWPT